jgi:TatD DNase family protein
VRLIDSHCHLDSKDFDTDREQVIERAVAAGVEYMMAIGTGEGPPDLEAGIRLAEKHPAILATVGVHPHDAAKATPETYSRLRDLLQHPKVKALGETGLDYHYDFSPPDVQRGAFIKQIRIARDEHKPIVIHTREAWADTLFILREHWDAKIGGIMHCFSGGPEQAEEALALGFYLSFGGIVTFPKANIVQESAKAAPEDRLLIETDAPFLAPVPYRGKRNEPAYVAATARRLGELRGTTADAIAAATRANFAKLIGLHGV